MTKNIVHVAISSRKLNLVVFNEYIKKAKLEKAEIITFTDLVNGDLLLEIKL